RLDRRPGPGGRGGRRTDRRPRLSRSADRATRAGAYREGAERLSEGPALDGDALGAGALRLLLLHVPLQVCGGFHFLALGDVGTANENALALARRAPLPFEAAVAAVAAPERELDVPRIAGVDQRERRGLLARVDEPGELLALQQRAGVAQQLLP